MNDTAATLRLAGNREAGACCPRCGVEFREGTPVSVCAACGTVHHTPCWEAVGGCGSYACSPGRRLLDGDEPVLKISSADLDNAVPLPGPRSYVATSAPPADPPRTSRLAIAALICAVAGIPFFGVVTGLVAVLLGCLALGEIRHKQQKGSVLASVGVLLGLGDMVGWVLLLSWALSSGGSLLRTTDFYPDNLVLDNLDPPLQKAMRANVLIESGRGRFGSRSIGSGIIMKVADGQAFILTNRHVVDLSFSPDQGKAYKGDVADLKLTVMMVDQSLRPGKVLWLAPGGVDLALVSVACDPGQVAAARWQMGRNPRIGDEVFAIGNPQGLGWTRTQGPISQFRVLQSGEFRLRVIQTQTVLNPGNSGGGLYDKEGFLIGVNTWSQDKRVSEGLNFAIAIDALIDVAPPELDLQAGSD